MQLIKLNFILLFTFCTTFSYGQINDLIVRKKLFTLRNARVNIGLNLATNLTFNDQENDERFNIFNYATSSLPDQYNIDYTQEDFPYFAGGIVFDLFSPNSILGLTVGAEYNFINFGLTFDDNQISTIRTQYVRFPAYLKFLTGDVHNQLSGLIMPGGYFALPLGYKRNGPSGEVTDDTEIQGGFGPSLILGVQYRFFDDTDQLIDGVSASRIWFYLRTDYTLYSLLTEDAFSNIFPNETGQLNVHPLNLSVGLGYFF